VKPAGLARLPGRPGAAALARAAGVLVLIASPAFGIPSWNVTTAVLAGILGLAALGVNVLVGYGRMVNLGGAAFLGLAAYGAVLGSTRFGIPYAPAALAAIAAAALVGWLAGGIFARLSGFYFAVAMLGVSAALEGVLAAFPGITEGDSGLTTARSLPLGVLTISSNLQWYAVTAVVTAIAIILTHRLAHGWRGRILALAREDPLAASVHGIDVLAIRRVLFTVGAALAALAGVLLARWEGVIVPQDAGLTQSVQLLGMAIVGGVGSRLGPLLGACLLTWLSTATSGLGDVELLIYGVIFFLVVAYFQGGVAGLVGMVANSRLVGGRLRALRWGAGAAVPPAGAAAAGSAAAAGAATLAPPPAAGLFMTGATGDGGPDGGLAAEGLAKHFGGVQAVREVTLTAPRGAVTVIVGGNGAGKSTVLNIISGIERPTAGTVRFGSEPLRAADPAQRARLGIARTFQTPRVAPDLTVLGNVQAGAEGSCNLALLRGRSGRPAPGLGDRCAAALHEVGLSHIAHRRMAEIGGGQRKLTEVARALAMNPELLLMDEPGAGLSLDEVALLTDLIIRLRDAGTGVVVVDHNLDFVTDIADAGYVLELGRVSYAGSAQGLRQYLAGSSGPPARSGNPGHGRPDGPPLGTERAVHG
jgi:branched-chain amino acid transport system permease protein